MTFLRPLRINLRLNLHPYWQKSMKENRQAAAGGFLQRLYVFLTPTATRMPRGFKFVIFNRLQTSPKCTVLEPELALTPHVYRNYFLTYFL